MALASLFRLGLAVLVGIWPVVCSCSGSCGMEHRGIGRPVSHEEHAPNCCGGPAQDESGGGMGIFCPCPKATSGPLESGSRPALPPLQVCRLRPYDFHTSVARDHGLAGGVIQSRIDRAPPFSPVFALVLRI